MALHDKGQGTGIFLKVYDRSIAEVFAEPQEGTKPLEVMNPETKEKVIKHVRKYGGVSGYINHVEFYNRVWNGKRFMGYKILLSDGEFECWLDLKYKSGPWRSFCKVAPNIDFSKPVYISAWAGKKQDGNTQTAFCIRQPDPTGDVVKQRYTKENPGDCPQWEKNKLGEWNSDKESEWLVDMIETDIIAKVMTAARDRGVDLQKIKAQSEAAESQAAAKEGVADNPADKMEF